MPEVSGIVWWMLTGVFAAGFALISYLLSHWFGRIERSLEAIWREIKESRQIETTLMQHIARIEARCDERHGRRD